MLSEEEELNKSANSPSEQPQEKDEETVKIQKKSGEKREDHSIEVSEELSSEKAGTGHREIIEGAKKITAETTRKDREETFAKAKIKEIRYNSKLLTGKSEKPKERISKIKLETARRLRVYTKEFDQDSKGEDQFDKIKPTDWQNKWFTLNYQRVGGSKHEFGIGLGDILLDPDITDIVVEKKDGQKVHGTRGVVKRGKHKGRLGFIDSRGNYIATRSGEKFMIKSGKGLNLKIANPKEIQSFVMQLDKEENDRSKDKKTFVEKQRKIIHNQGEVYSKKDVETYLKNRERIKKELGFSTTLPTPKRVKEIPPKEKDITRIGFISDTNKGYGKEGQVRLDQFRREMEKCGTDFLIGGGDHMAAGGGHDPDKKSYVSSERYGQLAKIAKEEFEKFDIPMALALGNHDLDNVGGDTDDLREVFREKLQEDFDYKENADGSAYSYRLGNAVFVVFHTGKSRVTESQTKFFEKRAAETKEKYGSLTLVTHIPPIQHAYGSGLAPDGSERLHGFDKIRKIAQDLESGEDGKNFYIFTGHNHLATALGNMLNSGSTASSYSGLPGKFRTVPSAAVIDINNKTGKIENIYFRDARSGFQDPLPKFQHAIATGAKEELLPKQRRLEDITPPGFNQETIQTATKECGKKARKEIDLVRNRPNFRKIVNYIAEQVGIPPSTIFATVKRESVGLLGLSGDSGTSQGLGHMKESRWNTAKSHPYFHKVMSHFTTSPISQIERAESVVADILAIAIVLKKGAEKLGLQIDHTSNISLKDLTEIRFYYHVPGYFAFMRKGTSHPRYHEAKAYYEKKYNRYMAWAKQSQRYQKILETS